jgi:Tol biopolymer transport system component
LSFPNRGAIECGPFWLPSGREIACTTYESGELQTLIRAVDGGSVVERLGLGTLGHISPKGRYVFLDRHNQTNLHGYLDLQRSRTEWIPLPGDLTTWGAGLRQEPSLSPDESTLVYRSARGDIEAVNFPACTNRVLVASGDGQFPQWSRDGLEIFYLTANGTTMMSVPVTSTPNRRFGQPVKLFDLPNPIFVSYRWSGVGRPFDVSADGQRFLIPRAVRDPERLSPVSEASVLLIQNWLAEFRDPK